MRDGTHSPYATSRLPLLPWQRRSGCALVNGRCTEEAQRGPCAVSLAAGDVPRVSTGCEAVPKKWAVLLGPANARNGVSAGAQGPVMSVRRLWGGVYSPPGLSPDPFTPLPYAPPVALRGVWWCGCSSRHLPAFGRFRVRRGGGGARKSMAAACESRRATVVWCRAAREGASNGREKGVAADGAGRWWGKGRKKSTERDERGSKSHVTFRTARTIGEKRRTCANAGCTGHPAALYIPGGRGNVVPIHSPAYLLGIDLVYSFK